MSLQLTGLAVKRLQMKHHREVNAGLAPLGITIVQWDALRHLADNPGASLHDLARLTFQTDQAFGTLAARMEARGLVERTQTPGRAVRHRLTEKGARLREQGAAIVEDVLSASFAPLTPAELATFEGMLARLV